MEKNAISALNNYFCSIVGKYRVARHSGNHDSSLGLNAQQEFVTAMNLTLTEIADGERTEIMGLGLREIEYMRDLAARLDWQKGSSIRELYASYAELRGKEPYPDFFFEGID